MTSLSERSSGVLLHVTALPGGEGIGDMGVGARRFVDWLARAGQSWWQVLPCTPTGFGESPYQSPSAYAGNPLMISLRELVAWELLAQHEIDEVFGALNTPVQAPVEAVDFDRVRKDKQRLLRQACERFEVCAPEALRADYRAFCVAPEQFWLNDYARFCVLKQRYSGAAWQDWPEALAQRDSVALDELDEHETQALGHVKLQQFLFVTQWQALRFYAQERGVGFIGDCPIYVATDSADVWAQRDLFDLCSDGKPRVVAGVPPDYFSATGQLWGNPLYLWERMRADGFAWWRSRVRHCASYFDVTRIDHFRGFDAYWEVPGDASDASSGCWQQGPGAALLDALEEEAVQLIAEDLGDLTASVHELRNTYSLPGMRVLQFGFDGGDDNPHAPESIGSDVICYVGTHDNNTTLGWYAELDDERQAQVCEQLDVKSSYELLSALLDLAADSRAPLCVLTMQDLLGLDATARFNTPGTVGGNWSWRMPVNAASDSLAESLLQRTRKGARLYEHKQPISPAIAAETAS